MIRAVIFDCFGVLYIKTADFFYEAAVPHYHEIREQLSEINRMSDYGLITQDDRAQQISKLTGLRLEEVQNSMSRRYVRNTKLLDYAQQLRARGLKVGLLSNISAQTMEAFFSTEERQTLFDSVVISSDEMLVKPNPAIFELMAERLGVTPGECIMIDDLTANCEGAEVVGMEALLYGSNATVKASVEALLAGS
ncbi:hypothetical protein CR983_03100 [Candidatus Saccharibacteria bacterium]|nr:MAG: hypothetical protein CR983_03100 [Candidatus Saccharibacteria bacterium]